MVVVVDRGKKLEVTRILKRINQRNERKGIDHSLSYTE